MLNRIAERLTGRARDVLGVVAAAGCLALPVVIALLVSHGSVRALAPPTLLADTVTVQTGSGQAALFATKRVSGTDGNNVCIGTGCAALSFDSTVGVHSASSITTLGTGAAAAFGSGADMVAVGAFALNAASGSQATQITAVGASAMINANGAIGFDTAVGQGALENITSGDNTAIGQASMLQQTSGGSNTAVGVQALEGGAGATCRLDVAVGLASNQLCTTGTANTAVGYQAMANATSASSNVAVGFNAAGSGAMTGNRNTCVGVSACSPITTGYGNAVFGNQAGSGITTGSQNTIAGPISASFVGAGDGIVAGSFNTVLGGCTGLSDTSGFVYVCDGSNTPRLTVDASGNVTSFGGPKNKGTVTMSTGTGTATITSGAVCMCEDYTTLSALTACSPSGTTLSIAAGTSDVVGYMCF